MTEQLVDAHGRAIGDIRISVTDRCNFRCTYCMPSEGLEWLPREHLLTFEEISRLVALFADMGVRDVRLTGGEPLMRRNLPALVTMLHGLGTLNEVSLTTNGMLLERHLDDLVAAGLTRLNISLDSLDRDRFLELARRDGLDKVMSALRAAAARPELAPVKVNAVAMRGFTEQEVRGFADLARELPVVVRFIEFMPLDADRNWKDTDVLTGREVRKLVEQHYALEPVEREASATATRWRFSDRAGEMGFISSVSEPFCSDCNRIRLTAEGMLRTCLFSQRETDLATPLRSGATDTELEQLIRDAVWRKELKHRIGDMAFVPPARSMSRIGG